MNAERKSSRSSGLFTKVENFRLPTFPDLSPRFGPGPRESEFIRGSQLWKPQIVESPSAGIDEAGHVDVEKI